MRFLPWRRPRLLPPAEHAQPLTAVYLLCPECRALCTRWTLDQETVEVLPGRLVNGARAVRFEPCGHTRRYESWQTIDDLVFVEVPRYTSEADAHRLLLALDRTG